MTSREANFVLLMSGFAAFLTLHNAFIYVASDNRDHTAMLLFLVCGAVSIYLAVKVARNRDE